MGHTQSSSLLTSRSPAGPTQPIRLAGTPAARAYGRTSWVTTAPAATNAQLPTTTGATHTTPAPSEAPSSIRTPTAVQSLADFVRPSVVTALGARSLVSTTLGPMNTQLPTTAGS